MKVGEIKFGIRVFFTSFPIKKEERNLILKSIKMVSMWLTGYLLVGLMPQVARFIVAVVFVWVVLT